MNHPASQVTPLPYLDRLQALKGKMRDFARVWNLDGRSAEICQIEWSGP